MKIMKNLFITIVSIISFFNAHAGTSGLLKSIQGPGFELYNKAPQTISIALIINGKFTTKNIGAGEKFSQQVDLKDTIRLGIFNKQTPNISTALGSGIITQLTITPQPDAIYDLNAPGKTKYITWNPAKSPTLYPQTGTYMGLSGKSDSGYPLGSNLQQSQIINKK
jgi:hypothetical protein